MTEPQKRLLLGKYVCCSQTLRRSVRLWQTALVKRLSNERECLSGQIPLKVMSSAH